MKCFEKVNDKQVEFGPKQLETGVYYISWYIICLDVIMASQYGSQITQSATASKVLQQYDPHPRNR